MTQQRQVILNELRKLKSHPTADELYPIVRKIIPNISLATVYRNLNWLADKGVVLRLEHVGQQKRFDGYVDDHYHFRCIQCDRLYDLDISAIKSIEKAMNKVKEHQIQGYNIVFFGICEQCKEKEEA